MDGTARPFTAYDIETCLFDSARVDLLRQAVFQSVGRDDVVVDAGSGTGLLGMFAAQAGAAKVYCVEVNRDFIEVIEANAVRNGMSGVIEAVHADAATVSLPGPVDVIISEVISAGFFDEPQLQIIANLRGLLKDDGRMVPHAVENFVELIAAEEQMYGLNFSFDGRYHSLPGDRALSNRVSYLVTRFHDDLPTSITATVQVEALETGRVNAIRIPYRIQLTPGVWVEQPTNFLMNPQVIFLPAAQPVRAGERYEIVLSYEAGSVPRRCKLEVRPVGATPEWRG